MKKSSNPKSNPITQALLDLIDAGYADLTVKQALSRLQKDGTQAAVLAAKYDARYYNQSNVKFVQVGIIDQLMLIDPISLKILVFMGIYADQNGRISAKNSTIARIVGVSERSCRTAIKSLENNGLIAVCDCSRRHEPPVWQVHPDVLHSGKIKNKSARLTEFTKIASVANSILTKDVGYLIQQDAVFRELPNGSKIHYHSISINAKKEPSDTNTKASKGSTRSKTNTTSSTTGSQADEIPGQLSFGDIDEAFMHPDEN